MHLQPQDSEVARQGAVHTALFGDEGALQRQVRFALQNTILYYTYHNAILYYAVVLYYTSYDYY